MLKNIFIELTSKYTKAPLAETMWKEIEATYTGKKRYYHNLSHILNMYNSLFRCKALITDWNTLLFSLFYHDIVYKATSKENEEKSADIAVKRLTEISYPAEKTTACYQQILATKLHALSPDNDTNLFTDADLAILGSDWDNYAAYYTGVRKEYSVYPDFLYKPGRAKALQHFLEMENIFKTDFFREQLEQNAVQNLKKE